MTDKEKRQNGAARASNHGVDTRTQPRPRKRSVAERCWQVCAWGTLLVLLPPAAAISIFIGADAVLGWRDWVACWKSVGDWS